MNANSALIKTDSGLYLPKNYTIYVKTPEREITERKLNDLKKIAEIKQWGIRNPTKFLKEFIGVELLDLQEYVFMNSWSRPFALWLESRNAGKSMMLAVFTMTKGLLFNNYRTFICSGTASQSQETFKKIEDIAMQRIESMANLTGFFKSEVAINNQNSNGFIHNPACFTYHLYNGSFVKTLNSAVDSARGYRAECVVFDEGGWLSEEQFNVFAAFTAQNSNFKLGGNVDVRTLPKEFPHQLLYASSASSVDTAFYKKFKDFSKKMFMGDPRYFVADITCDTVITATFHGKVYPTPLLTRDTVDTELRINPEKAMREYFNKFTRDGGAGQIIKRALIARNSFNRVPVLFNDTNKRKFVFAFDPARSYDNSVMGIGELIYDNVKGWTMHIVNCINFADLALKKKTPKTTQEQIRLIKKALLDYNGGEALDYENIECFMIDAGAGGGGNRMPDFFFEDWKDTNGIEHRGLIDPVYSEEYVDRYPHAVQNVLKLVEPAKYKSDMFEALIKMVEADLISFPERYDNKGYINLMHIDNEKLQKEEAKIRAELDTQELQPDEYEAKLQERLEDIDSATSEVYKLSIDEEIALVQINAMVEEIVNICRVKRESGKDGFKLPAYKDADNNHSEGTMHDDRAYVLAMLGWYLSEKRRSNMLDKPVQHDTSLADQLANLSRMAKRDSFFDY